MIREGFDFLAVMFGLCGALVWLEQQYGWRLFRWFPSIVLVMFGSMVLYTAGLWEMTPEISAARSVVRDNSIPAMLFLMSLRFDLSIIRRLGARLITLCLGSTLTIMLAFVVVHRLMGGFLGDETPRTFAVMSAGWTGGTQNFVAVKEALSVTDAAMTYTLLMGALGYSLWLIVILALKPYKRTFDRLLRSDATDINGVLPDLGQIGSTRPIDLQSLMLMLGISLAVASVSRHVGAQLASTGLLNPMIWAIILSSVLGMLAAPTKLGKAPGSDEISGIMLYLVVALIGAEVHLGAVTDAPLYILSGLMILVIHGILMLGIARILGTNLYLTGIASIANIGSAPSAAVVGAAYDRRLVPVAIIMALIGSMVGSFVGLAVGEILLWLSAS